MTAARQSGMLERLEAMLQAGQDSALLRFSLGSECMNAGRIAAACQHLEAAVQQDPEYSAAWKLLGRAYSGKGDSVSAAAAFRQGMEVAEKRGDVQAAKEMAVFLRRLQKTRGAGEGKS